MAGRGEIGKTEKDLGLNVLHLGDDEWMREQDKLANQQSLREQSPEDRLNLNVLKLGDEKWMGQQQEKYQKMVEKEGRFARLKTNLGKRARAAVLVGIGLFMAGGAEARTNKLKETNPKPVPENTAGKTNPNKPKVDMRTGKAESTEEGGYEMPGSHLTFVKNGPNGEGQWNVHLGTVISPVEVHTGYDETLQGQAAVDMPERFAKAFDLDPDAGKALNAEDEKKAEEFLSQELKRSLADTLEAWPVDMGNKEVLESYEGSPQTRGVDVESISITGYASPEGPVSKGKQTVEPGNVSPENIALANKRAEAAFGMTIDQLKKIGFTEEQLQDAAKHIDAQEAQFSPDEYDVLDKVAQKNGISGEDAYERIYLLLQDYDQGKITDAESSQQLDKIVASKRHVTIRITYKGNKRHDVSVPLPLLPVLMLGGIELARRLARRRRGAEAGESVDDDGDDAAEAARRREPAALEPAAEVLPAAVAAEIDPRIRAVELPTESEELRDMEERVYVDDLGVFFDDPATIARGLDYRAYATRMAEDGDLFASDEERELFLTQEILGGWEAHDLAVRREAGTHSGREEEGLDYENQPRQIQWARLHARALLGLVNEHNNRLQAGQERNADMGYILRQESATRFIGREARRIAESEQPAPEQVKDFILVEAPDSLRNTQLPPEDDPAYKTMKEETFINDLRASLENSDSDTAGIDYSGIADDCLAQYKDFASDSDRELYMADKLMKAWTEHDVAQAVAAGGNEQEARELYEARDREPNQAQYAKMHARALLRLVERKLNNQQETSYRDLLEAEIYDDEDLKEVMVRKARERIQNA